MIRRLVAWWRVRTGDVTDFIARIGTGGSVKWK